VTATFEESSDSSMPEDRATPEKTHPCADPLNEAFM
jgi:hypothetical protein